MASCGFFRNSRCRISGRFSFCCIYNLSCTNLARASKVLLLFLATGWRVTTLILRLHSSFINSATLLFLISKPSKLFVKFSTASCIMTDGFSSKKSIKCVSCWSFSLFDVRLVFFFFLKEIFFLWTFVVCCFPFSRSFVIDVSSFSSLGWLHKFLFLHISVFGLFNFSVHFFYF